MKPESQQVGVKGGTKNYNLSISVTCVLSFLSGNEEENQVENPHVPPFPGSGKGMEKFSFKIYSPRAKAT